MKKAFFAVVALLISVSASAFEFDGIDLNGNFVDVTRQISQKGYVFDEQSNSLKGNCQGNEIYLNVNYLDVTEKGKVGQLVVTIPMQSKNAIDVVVKTFNVVYHQTAKTATAYNYQVAEDGTQLVVTAVKDGVRLTYNTPYYNKK